MFRFQRLKTRVYFFLISQYGELGQAKKFVRNSAESRGYHNRLSFFISRHNGGNLFHCLNTPYRCASEFHDDHRIRIYIK